MNEVLEKLPLKEEIETKNVLKHYLEQVVL